VAQIDKQAALEELKTATRLKAHAEQLVEIADELKQEARSHEHDAMDLIAPGRFIASSRTSMPCRGQGPRTAPRRQ
jgi:hypothetical protein